VGVQVIQTVFSGVAVLAAGIGAIFGFKNWGKARRDKKRQFLSTYLKEYRDEDFGRAVAALWELYKDNGYDRGRLVDAYVKRAKEDERHFHFHVRRRVSAFYQEMGFLAKQDPDIMSMLKEVWNSGDLRIIKEVLLPIEREAIPQLLGERPPDDGRPIETNEAWPESFVVMANLYNTALINEARRR
jgi:hypothetical protein